MQDKVVGEEGWVKHGFTCPEQRISVNTFAERISRMSDLVSQRLQSWNSRSQKDPPAL